MAGHRLGDSIRPQWALRGLRHPLPPSLRYLYSFDRRREVTPRRQAIPQLDTDCFFRSCSYCSILTPIHAGRALVGLDPQIRLPDQPLGNLKRFDLRASIRSPDSSRTHRLITKRTRTTRPLRSTPITRSFTTTTGRSARCPRIGTLAPRRFSCLEFSLYADRVQHAAEPHRGERFPRSVPEPDTELAPPLCRTTIWPASRHPPDTSQGNNWTLVSVIVYTLSTLHQWFTRVRLLGSHLTPSRAPFPQRSPPRLIHRRSLRWFGDLPLHGRSRRAYPPSPVQHRIQKRSFYIGTSLQRSWHTVIYIAFEPDSRELPRHPGIERVMQKQVRQDR